MMMPHTHQAMCYVLCAMCYVLCATIFQVIFIWSDSVAEIHGDFKGLKENVSYSLLGWGTVLLGSSTPLVSSYNGPSLTRPHR